MIWETIHLTVLLYPIQTDVLTWAAQGLEVSLTTGGPSQEEAKSEFLKLVTRTLEEDSRRFSKLDQADRCFFDLTMAYAEACGPELPVYMPFTMAVDVHVYVRFLMVHFTPKSN